MQIKPAIGATSNGAKCPDRRFFIGGSDARIIMCPDEVALIQLWKEKRGEVEPEDLADNLIVQLGLCTEALNRSWYERNTKRRSPTSSAGSSTRCAGTWRRPSTASSTTSTPCSRPSSCCPGHSRKKPRPKSTWPSSSTTCGSPNARSSVLSIITGGGQWVEMTIPADSLYQHFLVTAERRFWRCVQTGETPCPYGVEPPRPRIEAVRIVDMSESNSWAELRQPLLRHAFGVRRP